MPSSAARRRNPSRIKRFGDGTQGRGARLLNFGDDGKDIAGGAVGLCPIAWCSSGGVITAVTGMDGGLVRRPRRAARRWDHRAWERWFPQSCGKRAGRPIRGSLAIAVALGQVLRRPLAVTRPRVLASTSSAISRAAAKPSISSKRRRRGPSPRAHAESSSRRLSVVPRIRPDAATQSHRRIAGAHRKPLALGTPPCKAPFASGLLSRSCAARQDTTSACAVRRVTLDPRPVGPCEASATGHRLRSRQDRPDREP